ncbi:TonB-dependent receptor [Novosphingobium mangrovi (ex Huang et al. 2023)]|uniref:TonB-dependent receptor n=1 Tax=Novosphingobium mangrovi (ex Huang et al. 2023) TaxID=2976432 RepID=A0ABT2I1T3_9SPHN|nr:TonB-dependent receptor [Novosphingobium mangrovi (ex Huang et al. 2023)]MCT2398761.1 TonB-dependent receptor [Novosphingobium mangrovi (ex Huang et al. 2023)]
MASGAVAGSLALALLMPVAARADDGEGGSSANLPASGILGTAALGAEILVTGAGLEETPGTLAYSTREIPREAIVSAPSGRIEDVLSSVAGFQQFRRSDSRSSNPSAQGVTLRAMGGNASSRALVLLDGVPMADPFFGYIPLPALAPERLGTVRVTRGGGSGPFGAGALSGTIELESARPDQFDLVDASLLANQRGESEASASIAPQLGSGFLVASGRWDRGKGFWTTPEDKRVPATARARFNSWSAGLRGVAPLTDTIELQARGLVFEDHRTLRFEGADSSTEGQDASLRLVGRGKWSFDALAYVQARNFTNIVVSSTRFVPVLDQYDTPATGIGGKFELRPPIGKAHTFRVGADWRRTSGTMMENAISAFSGQITARRRAGGRNTDLGLFIEDDWTLGPIVLTGGLRADRTRISGGYYASRNPDGSLDSETRYPTRSDWTVTYRAGALFRAGNGIALRAAAYSGIRLPTLNELYRPFTVFPVVTEANADLRSEKLEGYEAGIDVMLLEGVKLSVTAFDNRIRNAIANVTIGTNLRQRRNLPAIDAKGVEIGMQAARGPLRFDASLAWSDTEVRGKGDSADLDGMRPAQTPKFSASATLAVVPVEGWRLAATLRHVGKQYEDDLQTDVLPAATTLDAFVEVPLGRGASIVLRGENLFDENIITRNSGGSIDLGVPRTLWAGLRWGL